MRVQWRAPGEYFVCPLSLMILNLRWVFHVHALTDYLCRCIAKPMDNPQLVVLHVRAAAIFFRYPLDCSTCDYVWASHDVELL